MAGDWAHGGAVPAPRGTSRGGPRVAVVADLQGRERPDRGANRPAERRTLPVFGFREEAEMFLKLDGLGDGWRAKEDRGA